jgi:hypothetical protein
MYSTRWLCAFTPLFAVVAVSPISPVKHEGLNKTQAKQRTKAENTGINGSF